LKLVHKWKNFSRKPSLLVEFQKLTPLKILVPPLEFANSYEILGVIIVYSSTQERAAQNGFCAVEKFDF